MREKGFLLILKIDHLLGQRIPKTRFKQNRCNDFYKFGLEIDLRVSYDVASTASCLGSPMPKWCFNKMFVCIAAEKTTWSISPSSQQTYQRGHYTVDALKF